jgi:hypothetical protein
MYGVSKMKAVRDIIKEACTRANLVPRRQAVPGGLFETSYNHLKGLVSKLNNDNYLAFTQQTINLPMRESIHIYDEIDSMIPSNCFIFKSQSEMEAHQILPEELGFYAMIEGDFTKYYRAEMVDMTTPSFVEHLVEDPIGYEVQEMIKYMSMYQFHCPDVSKINTLTMIKMNEQNIPWTYELNFMPYDKFERCGPSDPVFTFVGKAEGEWIIQVKPMAVKQIGFKLKLNYNRALDFDIDDDLMVPDNYTELLITALTHKLALQFPRLDDAQMQRLENDLRVMVDNVRTPKADVRQVLRNMDYHGRGTMTQWELEAGNWIFGG